MWKDKGVGTEQKKKKSEIKAHVSAGLFGYTRPFWQSSLSFCVGLSRGEEARGKSGAVSHWGQRVWQCLVREVLVLSAKANSLWRQVGQHTYTHPQSGHRLVCPCLCLYAGWQPSHQLQSQWVQKITMVTNIVGQDVATLGSVRRLFFGICSVPQSITEFLLLNVLPRLAGELCVSVTFIWKTDKILKNNQTKTVAMRYKFHI